MLSADPVLLVVLAVAGLLAGVTGSWSPCGFSMVASLGPAGHAGGRRTTLAACAAFVPGALAGGMLTFGALGALGALLGGGSLALGAGAVLALAAALLELRGARIVPQIRRQVPEAWRRTVPLPLAAAGYGVLLGLGFTTFVLTFAVPALAAVAVAAGSPGAGLVLGLAFGIGRALPVVVLAPLALRPVGIRATELMAERPAVLRGFRAADALALVGVAAVLGTTSAQAEDPHLFADPAADPTAMASALAWDVPGEGSVLRPADEELALDGEDPALGDGLLALRRGDDVRVIDPGTDATVLRVTLPGAGPSAVSERWLVVRTASKRGDALRAAPLDGSAGPRTVAFVRAPAQLGRPSLDGDRLVFHIAGRRSSRIERIDLATGDRRTLREDTRRSYTHPTVLGDAMVYVDTSYRSQRVVLSEDGRERTLLRIAPSTRPDRGYERGRRPHRRIPRDRPPPAPKDTVETLWSTALTERFAYVTRLRTRDGETSPAVLQLRR